MSLSPEFLQELRAAAVTLGEAESTKSEKQWALSDLANDEWDENEKYYLALHWNQDDFNAAISQQINQAIGFTLITESGETLKMWREVARQFENVPAVLKAIPFEYFRQARKLWNLSKKGETIKPISKPIAPILEAQVLNLTANEMFALYVDPSKAAAGMKRNPMIDTWGPERKAAFVEALQEFEKEWFG